jgi:peptidoglycan/xylan/chitin deacetylase (PgdA/CDA1 family)
VKLGLRIEVNTYRGTRDGVPRLVALLRQFQAGATFLFNLGPDRSGRAPGSLPRVPKMKCYDTATLLSGTLLPAPDVGLRCRDLMRSVQSEGHEAGILALDRARWVSRIADADEAWTAEEMRRARSRYEDIFGAPALTHGAPGWRMNRFAYRHSQRLGFRHCSDTRGNGPFVPVVNAEIAACPQLPTTLPTLDELLAGGMSPDEAVRRLIELAGTPPRDGHVYTLRAEIEGAAFEPVLRALLEGWQALGHQPVPLRDYAAALDVARLPRCVIVGQAAPGSGHPLAAQGEEFLASVL